MGLHGVPPRRSTICRSFAAWCRAVQIRPSLRMSLLAREFNMAAPIARSILVLAAALASSLSSSFAATPVCDALQRPALAVREPQRAVLLSGAQAGTRVVAVGERGVVALSDDGGTTWRQAPCPVSVTLTMVRFADDRHGVAVGHGGTVLT